MKPKLSLYKKLLFRFRQWQSDRNMRILNKMVVFSMDSAIRLANKKRDILNHKCWVVGGAGQFLVFARYQKQGLQSRDLLKKNLTSKELDEISSYIAYPVTEKDKRRGGKIRIFQNSKNGKERKN